MTSHRVENSYDGESGIVTHAVVGDPDPDEINGAVDWREPFTASADFTRIIWDLTQADLSTADLKRFVLVFQNAQPTLSNGPGRIAIVASSLVEFGRSRQYAAVAGQHPLEIQVFDNMPTAKQWLVEV
jgi:hypothetical protein